MIDRALSFLKDELNIYIKAKTGDSDKAVLTKLVEQSGTSLLTGNELIAISLVNVEEERTMRAQGHQVVMNNGAYSLANPEIRLNLYVLFVGYNKQHHKEELALISLIAQFFQIRNVFENTEYPQLGDAIEKLIVELYSLNFEQQNQLWASIGAKYMPSLLFKVRMIIVNEKVPGLTGSGIGTMEHSFAAGRE
jgi:hypothetical protein